MLISRRDFIGETASALIGTFLREPGLRNLEKSYSRFPFPDLYEYVVSLRELGIAFLKVNPECQDLELLFQGLVKVPDDVESSLQALKAKIIEDFRGERLFQYDGWLLSETEAQISALAYLCSFKHTAS